MIGSVTESQAQLAEIEKRRKRKGSDLRDERPAATDGIDAVGEGMRAEWAREQASKATVAPEGPGTGMQPGPVEPERYRRPYLDGPGRSAEAPQAQMPRVSPMPVLPAGVPVPIAIPDVPLSATIHPMIAASYTMGSPSDK